MNELIRTSKMPISDEKFLQRIVKKYDLIQDPEYGSYAPKPTSYIFFDGGLLRYDDKIFKTCELEPSWYPEYKKVTASFYINVPRNQVNSRVKKIVEYYKKCDLLYKKKLLKDKIIQINKDF